MKIKALAIALLAAIVAMPMSAQSSIDAMKERKEINKEASKMLKEKASKEAQKEAKQRKKEGWKVNPGALPLERQLDRAWLMEMEGIYIMEDAKSVGKTYDAAKMQAMALARQNLAARIESEVTQIIDNQVANQQISGDDAASIVKSLNVGKSYISQHLGNTISVVECYRPLKNGNVEVLVKLAYSKETAFDVARRAIEANLGDDLNDLHGELIKIR